MNIRGVGTPPRGPADGKGEAETPRRPAGGKGEEETPRRPADGKGEEETPRRPADGKGVGTPPRRPADGKGEEETPRRPADGKGPLKIGLTGSIGMGKSTVAQMLRDAGVPVFDADAEVHRLQGPGGALLPAIEAAFPGTTSADGVDRARLGAIVFGDDQALATLEAVVHPAVGAAQAAFLAANDTAALVVFDIPLLFERGGAARVDQIIVVSTDAAQQRRRVLARPGMTPQKFAEILARQTPDADKRARADHVVDTSGSFAATRARLGVILACLQDQAGA